MTANIDVLAPGLLIASPLLKDPNFDHSVVLMCVHNEEGALGLVINRVSPFNMREILGQLGMECRDGGERPALVGGPVGMESGMLLYRTEAEDEGWPDEIRVTDELRLCPSQELLEAIGRGEGPTDYWMFLGHAGWAPAQLEREMAECAWIPGDLNLDLLFATELDDRWEAALKNEGLTPAQVSFFRPPS